MINIPKGTKDVLPSESYKWQYIEKKAREIANLFNVFEVRTPIFEHSELFLRGVGETTDIVNKEMYTFLDKGNRSITLKPEGTAGVVRSFIEKGMYSLPLPLKMYYFTPVFRYEHTQHGRLREHHQFGVEIFGSSSYKTDAELISLADSLLNALGITNLKLFINSIGCKDCRGEFNKKLREFYIENYNTLCPLCKSRLEKNPLRILDCKEEKCSNLNKSAPVILDSICGDCEEHFDGLKQTLNIFGIPFEVNPTIVRGLDYYSKTVFEFVSENLGAKSTVCGGGRYDALCEILGGKPMPAVGFGMGIERLIIIMDNLKLPYEKTSNLDIFIATLGEKAEQKALELIQKLRKNGVSCEMDTLSRSLKAQLKYADKQEAKYCLIIGENEIDNDCYKLKNMSNGEEITYTYKKLLEFSR